MFKNKNELVRTSRNFYSTKSQTLCNNNSCAEYLEKVEWILTVETELLESCLDQSKNTTKLILKEFDQEFLKNYKPTLLEKETGFSSMLRSNQSQVLEFFISL